MIEAGNTRLIETASARPKPDGFDRGERIEARFQERHFTVAQIAELWNLSPDVVRKLFEGEPGVLVIGDDAPRGKRRYTTLRIPQSVVERVHRRLCNPEMRRV